jgi:AAA ATPase domain
MESHGGLNDSAEGHRYSSNSGSHLSALSMVTSVEIRNFRGFEEIAVSDLASINIIVGDNASGKTAFLESIYLGLHPVWMTLA